MRAATSSLGDQVAGAHIIEKYNSAIVVGSAVNDAWEYLNNCSTVGILGGIK